jgi:hypothetical protein
METGTTDTGRDYDKWFRMRYTSTSAFVVGILLFFLPFAEISCNDTVIASNSGLGMATGQEWNMHGFPTSGDLLKNHNSETKDARFSGGFRDWPNILSLVALLAGAGGLVVSLTRTPHRSLITMSAGLLGAVMLIAMMIQLNMELKSGGGADAGFGQLGVMMVKVSFSPWCYMAVVAFGLAAFFGYKHHKLEEKEAIENAVDFEFQRSPEEPDKQSPQINS